MTKNIKNRIFQIIPELFGEDYYKREEERVKEGYPLDWENRLIAKASYWILDYENPERQKYREMFTSKELISSLDSTYSSNTLFDMYLGDCKEDPKLRKILVDKISTEDAYIYGYAMLNYTPRELNIIANKVFAHSKLADINCDRFNPHNCSVLPMSILLGYSKSFEVEDIRKLVFCITEPEQARFYLKCRKGDKIYDSIPVIKQDIGKENTAYLESLAKLGTRDDIEEHRYLKEALKLKIGDL